MSTGKCLTMAIAAAGCAATIADGSGKPLLAQTSLTLIATARRELGARTSGPQDINDRGQIVTGAIRPFLWTAETGPRDLGFEGAAVAINSAGHVVGYWNPPSGPSRAFLWSEETGMRELPFPACSGTLVATDVNDSDMIVAHCSTASGPRQYAWSPTLGVRVISAQDGTVSAVNDSGVAVGSVQNDAYRWTADAGLQTLPPRRQGEACTAAAINNLGDIVGSCSGDAILWRASGGIVDLGDGTAWDINDRGMVVGTVSFAVGTINRERAFAWTAASGRVWLGEGRLMTVDINNLGQVIVWNGDTFRTAIYQIRSAAPPADIDSDALGDFIFQQLDGRLGTWLMNGTSLRDGRLLTPPAVDRGWRVVGTPDADGDGGIDLLFRHDDGRLAMWELSGTNLDDGYMLQPDRAGDANWRICGTGDVNADGYDDVFWQHVDGSIAVWILRAGRLIDGRLLDPRRIERPWDVVGIGDINGDQSPDLILQKGAGGALAVWMMAGQTLVDGSLVSRNVPPGWRLGAIRDLNGDGPADLTWQTPNGQLVAWFMRGAQVLGTEPITPSTIAEGWMMVGPR